MATMAGARDDVPDSGQLQARVAELDSELRLRMADVRRLDRELRHARADLTVKDEYIEHLAADADKLQAIREVVWRIPLALKIRVFVARRTGSGPDVAGARPAVTRKAAHPAPGRVRSDARRAVGRLAPHGSRRAQAVNTALGVVHGTGGHATRPPGS